MIKKEELRIDNLVYDQQGRIAVVDIISRECGVQLSTYKYYVDSLEGSIQCKDIKPIPITEENIINLDLGFRDEGDGLFKTITNNLELVFTYDEGTGVRLDIDTENLRVQTEIKVKYIHSLQNLIHDLTQKKDQSCLCRE